MRSPRTTGAVRLFVLIPLLFLSLAAPAVSQVEVTDSAFTCEIEGTTVPGHQWLPARERKVFGVLVCVHGFGLNSRSYEDFGARMAAEGFPTLALDVRGFGAWHTGDENCRIDLDKSVQDTITLVEQAKSLYPGAPVFLIGESMGGAIALNSVASFPKSVKGIIASVPSSERFDRARTSLSVGLRLLTAPTEEIDVSRKVVSKAVSDSRVKNKWLSDPGNRLNVTPSELLHFQRFMNRSMERARTISSTPVLIVQGCKDKLVRPESTIELYNNIKCSNKKLLLVGRNEHLIFQKGMFTDQTIEMLVAWLKNCASGLDQNERLTVDILEGSCLEF